MNLAKVILAQGKHALLSQLADLASANVLAMHIRLRQAAT
jgi:hypothetical protein